MILQKIWKGIAMAFTLSLSSLHKKLRMHITQLKQSSVARNFMIYSFGSIILRSVSILLAPITLTLLSPSDYGLLALVNSCTNVLVAFTGFGLRQVFGIEYFHCSGDARKRMGNEIIVIYLALSLPVFALLYWHIPTINAYIFFNNASSTLIKISLFFCFIYFFVELFYQILQVQGKALALTTLQIAVAMLTIACNIISLYWFKWGVSGMMLGYVLGMLIVCAAGLYAYMQQDCVAYINVRESLRKTKYYLHIGLPFIPTIICNWVLATGNRWLLARYATLHDVGIYSLADTVSSLFQMLVLFPMLGSYVPHVFKKFAANPYDLASVEHWNRQNMYVSMLAMTALVTLGYFCFKPCMLWLLPKKFHAALDYVLPILLGNIFWMGTYFAVCLVQYKKKAYFIAATLITASCVNVLGNIILIPRLGLYGCTLATMAAYGTYFGLLVWYGGRLMRETIRST
jgi:O-antigen/teichoic acid export membrane protein